MHVSTLLLIALLGQQPIEERSIDRLVSDLASPAYRIRAEASEELLQRGLPAVPALREAIQSDSAEQRVRASQLVRVIETAVLVDRARQFVETGEIPTDCVFPGWSRFHEKIGDDRASREIYAMMVEAEPGLMWQLDLPPQELSRVLDERCVDIVLLDTLTAHPCGLEYHPEVGTTCALLFAAAHEKVSMSSDASYCLNNLVVSYDLTKILEGETEQRDPMRRLVGCWLDMCSMSSMQRLSLAARFDLPQGVDAALDLIRRRASGRQQQYAVFYLAKMGEPEHLALFEEMLRDETVLDTRRYGDVTVYETRVQDVALVAALHMTGQDPVSYGFDKLRDNSQFLYQPDSAGFSSDTARRIALQKWWVWRAENLRENLPAPEQADASIPI